MNERDWQVNNSRTRLWRLILPLAVFFIVIAGHFVWLGLFPESDNAQSQWVPIEPQAGINWLQRYLTNQDYWLGISYALSLAFATYAIVRYLEERQNKARNMAIGGVTFTGFLAAAGCFLVGCCGSPMLVVYLNLFGAAFLPFLKPIVTLITLVSIAGAFYWMHRRKKCRADCECSMVNNSK